MVVFAACGFMFTLTLTIALLCGASPALTLMLAAYSVVAVVLGAVCQTTRPGQR